jgi:Integrase core domain
VCNHHHLNQFDIYENHSQQVPGAQPKATLTNLANVPEEPSPEPCFHRLLHVPTIRFQILYVFLVLAHERRRIVHFAVTAHPTAEWTAHQLREAFPWERAPRYLLRDRDRIFGHEFVEQVKTMGIQQVLSAPRSPWQRAHIERVIGSIRRECLDHLIVFNKGSLKRHLQAYADYYHRSRTHLALDKDCPQTRAVQSLDVGPIVSIQEVWWPAPSLRAPGRLKRNTAIQRDPMVLELVLTTLPSCPRNVQRLFFSELLISLAEICTPKQAGSGNRHLSSGLFPSPFEFARATISEFLILWSEELTGFG